MYAHILYIYNICLLYLYMLFNTVALLQTAPNQNYLTQNSNTPAGGKYPPSKIISYKYKYKAFIFTVYSG